MKGLQPQTGKDERTMVVYTLYTLCITFKQVNQYNIHPEPCEGSSTIVATYKSNTNVSGVPLVFAVVVHVRRSTDSKLCFRTTYQNTQPMVGHNSEQLQRPMLEPLVTNVNYDSE